MGKHLYRTLESLLEKIDHTTGSEQILNEILELLVNSPEASHFGIASGRVYRERKNDYKLIHSIGEHGSAIAGKTVSKNYQVIQDLQREKLWVISPSSPGWDAKVETQFSDQDSTAIMVGNNPAYIVSLSIRNSGTEDDLTVLLWTIRASVGVKLREQTLSSQLRQAQLIQQSLLPAELPQLQGFDIAAISIPAEEVGGDVYDVQIVEEGVAGLLLADSSGHGLPAALQARDVIIGMRMGQAEGEKITTTVSRLNRVINRSSLSSRFISLFYGELEDTGNMPYVNCGHCPPLYFASGDQVCELITSGPVLGPLPDVVFRRGYVYLRPGELLVIFSDGVTEREDPISMTEDEDCPPLEFGRDNLIKTVQRFREKPASEIISEVIRQVREFGGNKEFSDDVSLMVIKREAAENYPPVAELTCLPTDTK